jgi:hypothetical protein
MSGRWTQPPTEMTIAASFVKRGPTFDDGIIWLADALRRSLLLPDGGWSLTSELVDDSSA